MILFDTNIVVAYFNGDEQVVSKIVEKINRENKFVPYDASYHQEEAINGNIYYNSR